MGLSPVREALNRVSRDGLVQQSDLRGFSVAPVTERDLIDLTRARCWLNELALRQSIANGGPEWEEGIVLAYHRFTRTLETSTDTEIGGRNAHEAAHRHFHASLISACGSERLRDYCEQLFDAADRYRYLKKPAKAQDSRKGKGHHEIMEAVLARDIERAVLLLTTHFRDTERIATTEMRRRAAMADTPLERGSNDL